MPRHPGLPRGVDVVLRKTDLLATLLAVDESEDARKRVLEMEVNFRERISAHLDSLPLVNAQLSDFNTSPYVLLMSAMRSGYDKISQIEGEILPAKLYSSMETSAGRMIEAVTLPVFGWEVVESEMHTANSALDGKRAADSVAEVATLKSGPRTLNDEMAENFADAVINHAQSWAHEVGGDEVRFTYGALYGTQRQSNKKDWHILRQLAEKTKASGGTVLVPPSNQWRCEVELGAVSVEATVRNGLEWWEYLGGATCAAEVWISLIRACVQVGESDPGSHTYAIADLAQVVSMRSVPPDFNVSLLQRSQLPWFFFVARHFCDRLEG